MVTIKFEPPNNTEDFIDYITLDISTKDDGTPVISSGQLLNILVRCTAVLTVLSCKKLEEVYFNTSQFSSLIADAVKDTLENKFQVNIRIDNKKDVN